MKMKKLLALFTASIFIFIACGGNSEKKITEKEKSVANEQQEPEDFLTNQKPSEGQKGLAIKFWVSYTQALKSDEGRKAIKEGKLEDFQDQFIDNSLKKLYPDLNEINYDRHHEEFATILDYFEENDSDVKKLKEEWEKTYLEISRN
jgi:hypothetical protein